MKIFAVVTFRLVLYTFCFIYISTNQLLVWCFTLLHLLLCSSSSNACSVLLYICFVFLVTSYSVSGKMVLQTPVFCFFLLKPKLKLQPISNIYCCRAIHITWTKTLLPLRTKDNHYNYCLLYTKLKNSYMF